VGAAAMFATTIALLGATYQGRDRGIAFGMWGAVGGTAATVGPVCGGLLTQHLGWRWIFAVNIPISVIAIVITVRVLRESKNPDARRIDLPGNTAFTLAAAAVTYALIRANENGWISATTLGLIGAGAVGIVAFVVIERRSMHPMLDISLFRNRSFLGIMLGALLMNAAAWSYLPYTSLWLQSVLGLDPVDAGLVCVPLSLSFFVVAAAAGRTLHNSSPRFTIGVGALLVGAGDLLQVLVSTNSDWTILLPGFIVAGIGAGMAIPSLVSAAMGSVAVHRGGMASGAVNTFRQLGFVFGVAVLGSIFASRTTDALRGKLSAEQAAAAAAGHARAVIGGSAATDRLVRSAFASGLDAISVAAAGISVAAAILVVVLVRKPAPQHAERQLEAEPAVSRAR